MPITQEIKDKLSEYGNYYSPSEVLNSLIASKKHPDISEKIATYRQSYSDDEIFNSLKSAPVVPESIIPDLAQKAKDFLTLPIEGAEKQLVRAAAPAGGVYAGTEAEKAMTAKPAGEPTAKELMGFVEAPVSLATGMAGFTAGAAYTPFEAVGRAILGSKQPVTEAAEVGKKIAQFLTYQPKTETGQVLTQAATYPLEKIDEGLRTGLQKLGASEETISGIMQGLYGGMAIMPFAKKAMKPTEMIKKEISPEAIKEAQQIEKFEQLEKGKPEEVPMPIRTELERQGMKVEGIQENFEGKPSEVVFTDPKTESSLQMKLEDFKPETLTEKIESSRAAFETPGVIMGMNFPQMSGEAKGIFTKIKEFFVPGSTIPESAKWLELRQAAKGEVAKGESFTKHLVERYNYLKPDERKMIWDYLTGSAYPTFQNPEAVMANMPQHLRPIALRFRTIDNVIGRKLMDSGVISKETFEANQGKHIKYIYDIYMGERKTPTGINKAAFKAKEDMTDLERERIGLVKDPLKALSTSILEGTKASAMADYFKSIGENPQWIFEPSVLKVPTPEGGTWKMGIGKAKELLKSFEEVEKFGELTPARAQFKRTLEMMIKGAERTMGKPSEQFVQLSGDKFGDLNGAYINRTIANDVRPLWVVTTKDSSQLVNAIKTTIATGNAIWKMKNVALNLPTGMRNLLISNPIQMNMSGTPLYKVPHWFMEGIKSMKNEDWKYKAAQKQGLFTTNWSASELNEILEIASKWDGTKFGSFLDGIKDLGKYYGKIDDLWKMAKFAEQIELRKTVPQAAREANKWIMDYSLVHPAVKELRSAALGMPYITYQYKIVPLIAETLVKRPWVIAKFVALPYILQEALTKDMTDEDAQKYIDSLPEYVKSGQVLLIPGQKGVSALDMSYLVPWGNIWQMGVETKNGRIWKATKELGLASGLLPSVLYALTTNRDLFTDQPVISEFGEYDKKTAAWDITKYIWKLSMPSMLTGYGAAGRIYEHEKYGQTSKGLPTEWYHAYPRLVGLNIYPVDLQGGRRQLIYDILSVRKELKRRLRDRNLDPKEREKIRDIYKYAISEIKGENEISPPENIMTPQAQEEEE